MHRRPHGHQTPTHGFPSGGGRALSIRTRSLDSLFTILRLLRSTSTGAVQRPR